MSPLMMGSKQVKAVSAEELSDPVGSPRAGPGVRRGRARPAGCRVGAGGRRQDRRADLEGGQPHRGRARGCDRLGQVQPLQRAGRGRRGRRRRSPAHDLAAGGRGLGRRGRHRAARLAVGRAAPPRDAARQRRRPTRRPGPSTAWSCSTCPTSTRGSSPTGSSPSGCWSSSTCSSGSPTRRSTPTPGCTTTTCGCWPPTTPSRWWSSTRPTASTARQPARSVATCRGWLLTTGSPACRSSPPPPPPAPGSTTCGCGSRPPWPPRTPPSTACSPTCRPARARCAGEWRPPSRACPTRSTSELVDALARAAGIPTVVAAVERDYRNQAWGRTGWPFTRWVRALRPDPMKRLRLNTRDAVEEKLAVTAGDVRTVLGRSSLPPPTPAARSAVELATRRVGDQAAEGLPNRWAEAVADAATPAGPRARRRARPGGRRHLAEDASTVVVAGLRRGPARPRRGRGARIPVARRARRDGVAAAPRHRHPAARTTALPAPDVRRWAAARAGPLAGAGPGARASRCAGAGDVRSGVADRQGGRGGVPSGSSVRCAGRAGPASADPSSRSTSRSSSRAVEAGLLHRSARGVALSTGDLMDRRSALAGSPQWCRTSGVVPAGPTQMR